MTNQTFLVGTGIEIVYVCSLTSDGQLQLLTENKCGKGSTWLLPRDNLLHVINEFVDKIETFTIDDRNQGKLTLKNTISAKGDTPCSLDIDESGKWLAVANYGAQGTPNFVVFPINDSGLPEENGAQVTSIEGRGPNPDRQTHSYCHHAVFYKKNLYVIDLGTDTVNVYNYNNTNGEVNLVGNRLKTEAGAGPRHIIFHPNRPLAFVCNELNSTTNVYRVDESTGQLELIQTINTRRQEDENDTSKQNYPAELQFTPDGKCLIVSNRGDENLVIFNINDDDSNNNQILTVQQHLDVQGSFTRYFTFDPTGKFLLVCNQRSNNLVCFSYNNGTYTYLTKLENINSPQHLVFL